MRMRSDLHTRLMASVLIRVDDGKIVYRKGPESRFSSASALIGLVILALIFLALRGFLPL